MSRKYLLGCSANGAIRADERRDFWYYPSGARALRRDLNERPSERLERGDDRRAG